MLPYNKKLSENARNLRRNMTPEERHLWYDFLKNLSCRVKRQYRIENYIVDFYVASKKIVIEIDGIRLSASTSGEFLAKGTSVRVVGAEGDHLLIKKI